MRLQDKVAIVTGGASGFGAGIVKHFCAAGARVVLADLDEVKGEAVARACSRPPAEAVFIRTDVTAQAQVQAAVDLAVERFGRLDVLVNNAGIGQRPVALEDTPDAVYDALYEANVKSVFLGCRSAVPVLKQGGGGVIINTASGIALRPRPGLVVYGATKGAVATFTRGLAMELAEHNIRVNALCPAAGDTPMLAEFQGGEDTPEGRAALVASSPVGRLISGDDMGAAAVYLASDEAAVITGVCFPVDGGRCI